MSQSQYKIDSAKAAFENSVSLAAVGGVFILLIIIFLVVRDNLQRKKTNVQLTFSNNAIRM